MKKIFDIVSTYYYFCTKIIAYEQQPIEKKFQHRIAPFSIDDYDLCLAYNGPWFQSEKYGKWSCARCQ